MSRIFLAVAMLIGAAPVAAQVLVLDEGTFTHRMAGTRVGREDFSVRTVRGGASIVFVAQANVLTGEQRRSIALNADSAGTPTRFQLETRDATGILRSVVGERDRSTWLARTVAGPRESGREFRLGAQSFITEPGVVHHLWFVLRFGQAGAVTLLVPSGNLQIAARLQAQEAEAVEIGGRHLEARRWELRATADDSLQWEFWADASGHLLRARHPTSGLEALRDDPPSETLGR
jgi:hypothetical protein